MNQSAIGAPTPHIYILQWEESRVRNKSHDAFVNPPNAVPVPAKQNAATRMVDQNPIRGKQPCRFLFPHAHLPSSINCHSNHNEAFASYQEPTPLRSACGRLIVKLRLILSPQAELSRTSRTFSALTLLPRLLLPADAPPAASPPSKLKAEFVG